MMIECPEGHYFDHTNATAAFFAGDMGKYQCPDCGEWTSAPPPS